MLSSGAALALFGEGLGATVLSLARKGVANATARPVGAGAELCGALLEAARALFPLFAAILAAALIGAVLPAALAKRKRGRTAVPLPPAPKARLATAVIYLFGAGVVALSSIYILRGSAGAASGLLRGDLGASESIFRSLCKALAAGGAVMLLVGLAEISLLRTEIWKALHLDSREARRELRAAGQDQATKREGARRARRQA